MKRSLRFLTLPLIIAMAILLLVGCQSAAPQAAPTTAPAKPAATTAPAKPAATTAPAAAQPTSAPAATKPAAAAAFPTRPIEFVVPYSPGGGSGITAETLNKIVVDEKLSPQPLTITYKPGASGQIGWAYLAGRKGDAHTIATATSSFITGPLLGQSPLKMEEFTPIAGMADDLSLMVTFPNSPYKTIKDVIDASKAKPGSVTIAGTGAAGADATVAALIEQAAGIKFNLIPFDSGAEVNAAILGGQVDLAISNPNELFPNIEAGKLRPIVVFSNNRLSVLKDVPTMKEEGQDIVFVTVRGIVAPAGITDAERDWLAGLMKKVTESPAWKEYADKNMMQVVYRDPANYKKYLTDEQARLKQLFTTMGLIKK